MPRTPTSRNPLPPIAIVVSRYNESVTAHLRDGAVRAYVEAGGDATDLAIVEAPGAFEIPLVVQEATLGDVYHGVVALGCVVRGETDHDRYLADAVTKALLDIGLDSGVPIGLGVLTVNTVEQAVARSGGLDGTGDANKGHEAMRAVLGTIGALAALATTAGAGAAPGVRYALSGAASDKVAGGRRATPRSRSGRGARK